MYNFTLFKESWPHPPASPDSIAPTARKRLDPMYEESHSCQALPIPSQTNSNFRINQDPDFRPPSWHHSKPPFFLRFPVMITPFLLQ